MFFQGYYISFNTDLIWLNLLFYPYFQVTSKSTGEEKLIVRGYKHCKWHKNIFQQTEEEIGTSFSLKCVGGGRINHEPQKRNLFVYGYSQVGIYIYKINTKATPKS